MSESKQIPVVTTKTVTGSSITIFTYYDATQEELPNILAARIMSAVGSQNGTSYKEGELIVDMKNYPSNIDSFVDVDGNLIVTGDTGDINSYSIDSNGDLKWIN